MRYPIRGKNPLFGVLTSYGVPSRGKIKKFLRIPHAEKPPEQKISQIGTLFENSIFLPHEGPRMFQPIEKWQKVCADG